MKDMIDRKEWFSGSLCSYWTAMMVSFLVLVPVLVNGSEKLMVKDSSGNPTFKVEDTGTVLISGRYSVQGETPGFWLDETGTGKKGSYFVLDEKWMQVQRRAQDFGAYEGSPVFIHIDAPHSALVLSEVGHVGLGRWAPEYPLHMSSGAYCTSGGVWTNASSKKFKEDIQSLTHGEALEALAHLTPVKFRYKAAPKETHVGFIAEEAPDLLVATDKSGMSPMDVVAVLTRVVQDQQRTIEELKARLSLLEDVVQ